MAPDSPSVWEWARYGRNLFSADIAPHFLMYFESMLCWAAQHLAEQFLAVHKLSTDLSRNPKMEDGLQKRKLSNYLLFLSHRLLHILPKLWFTKFLAFHTGATDGMDDVAKSIRKRKDFFFSPLLMNAPYWRSKLRYFRKLHSNQVWFTGLTKKRIFHLEQRSKSNKLFVS